MEAKNRKKILILMTIFFTGATDLFACNSVFTRLKAGLTLNFDYEKGQSRVLTVKKEGNSRLTFNGCGSDKWPK